MNGLFGALDEDCGPIDPSLFKEPLLLRVGLRMLAGEGIAESIDPNRPGKFALSGERALVSKVMVEVAVCGMPLILKPDGSSSGLGVGGVGVRGGAGIGRLEAIAVFLVNY